MFRYILQLRFSSQASQHRTQLKQSLARRYFKRSHLGLMKLFRINCMLSQPINCSLFKWPLASWQHRSKASYSSFLAAILIAILTLAMCGMYVAIHQHFSYLLFYLGRKQMLHHDQLQISISRSSDITRSSGKNRIFIFVDIRVDMAICFQRLTRLSQFTIQT